MLGNATVGAAELRGGPGWWEEGRKRVWGRWAEEEGVGEMSKTSQVVDGKRQKEDVVGVQEGGGGVVMSEFLAGGEMVYLGGIFGNLFER